MGIPKKYIPSWREDDDVYELKEATGIPAYAVNVMGETVTKEWYLTLAECVKDILDAKTAQDRRFYERMGWEDIPKPYVIHEYQEDWANEQLDDVLREMKAANGWNDGAIDNADIYAHTGLPYVYTMPRRQWARIGHLLESYCLNIGNAGAKHKTEDGYFIINHKLETKLRKPHKIKGKNYEQLHPEDREKVEVYHSPAGKMKRTFLDGLNGDVFPVDEPDVSDEERIFLGLICDDGFCSKICPIINPKWFKNPEYEYLARWVKQYWEKYSRAPAIHIKELVAREVKKLPLDEDDREAEADLIPAVVDQILSRHSEYINYDFYADIALDWLKEAKLRYTLPQWEESLNAGNVDDVAQEIIEYETPAFDSDDLGVDFFGDAGTMAVFDDNDGDGEPPREYLFRPKGDLGVVVGTVNRGDFAAVLAPPKAGKTFMLQKLCMEAMRENNKVLYITCEMTEKEMTRRFWSAMCHRPIKDTKNVAMQTYEKIGNDWTIVTEYRDLRGCNEKAINKALKWWKKFHRDAGLRIKAVPTNSLTVQGLRHLINSYIKAGFTPDVVCIDYADIMQTNSKTEYRNQLDYIWKSLRGMAKELDMGFITASQTNRSGMKGAVGATSIAEDYRKIAHVTSLVAITKHIDVEGGFAHLVVTQEAMRNDTTNGTQMYCLSNYALSDSSMDCHPLNKVLNPIATVKKGKSSSKVGKDEESAAEEKPKRGKSKPKDLIDDE